MGRLALGWLGDRKTRRIGNLPPKVGGTTRAPAAPGKKYKRRCGGGAGELSLLWIARHRNTLNAQRRRLKSAPGVRE